jgi:hypothetical protein
MPDPVGPDFYPDRFGQFLSGNRLRRPNCLVFIRTKPQASTKISFFPPLRGK